MLNKKKLQAIDLIIEGKLNKKEIANILHVSRQTIYDWIKDSEFNQEFEIRRDEYINKCKNRLIYVLPKAMEALEKLLTDKNANAKFLAVKEILNQCGLNADNNLNSGNADKTEVNFIFPEVKSK